MESLEAFGTNGTSDQLHPELTKSLLDGATLTPGLDGNLNAVGLERVQKAPAGKDPLQSQLDYLSNVADNPDSSKPNLQFSPDSIGVIGKGISASPSTITPSSADSLPPRVGNALSANSTTNFDPLTGSTSNTPLVSSAQFDSLAQSQAEASTSPSSNSTFAATTASSTIPEFAIKTEGTISINNGGDFDGDPVILSDDALIYARKGFTINGNPTLPVQRDANGNPIRNAQGKLVLVDKAVAVSTGYTVSNGPSNTYANLIPPQVIEEQTVNVPAYADVKQQELTRRIPTGTPTVTFNASANPMNNATEWAQKFPSPGTASQPKVVRVTGGGLNIPSSVNLSNYVITVESGDINFNGSGHNLNNVMLVTNGGNINLATVQSKDSSVLASGGVNMNSGARFAGNTLVANGSSSGSLNFNGATATFNPSDMLTAISQGSITFNGAATTRGTFLSAKDFNFNVNSTLYGSIGAKGNIIFNNAATVVAAFSDTTPPAIAAALSRDTAPGGTTNTDKITSDPTIAGTVTDASAIASFKAGFNSTPTSNFTNILPQVGANGSFTLARTQLEQIYGGTLPDGAHTLHLQAQDAAGNVSNLDVSFTLDTAEAAPTLLSLDPPSDSGTSDSDRVTNDATPTITGNAAASTTVQLFGNGQLLGQTTTAANGTWAVTANNLADGTYALSAKATDAAGNVSAASAALNVVVDTTAPSAPSNLKLTAATDTGASSSDNITNNPTPTIQGNAAVGSLVKLFKNGQLVRQTTATSSGDWQLSAGTLADGQYAFTATAEDSAGNVSTASSSLTVKVDTAIAAPTGLDLLSTSDSGSSDSDNVTNNTTPTVAGSAEALAVVQLLSDGQVVGQATATENGSWQITPTTPLTQGTHTLTAKATDKAGNVSQASAPLNVVIDTTAPTAPSSLKLSATTDTGTSNSDGITNNPTPTLEGIAEAGSLVRAYKDGQLLGQTTATSNGDWQLAVNTLADGNYTFAVTAEDSAGNVSSLSASLAVTVDTTAPSAPDNLDLLATSDSGSSATDNVTNNSTPEIAGTAAVDAVVQLFDREGQLVGQTTANASGNWQTSVNSLADGERVITAKATDVAGNTSDASAPLNLTIDTAAPNLNVTAPTANATLTTGARLSGTVGGTGTTVAGLSYQWDSQTGIALTPNAAGDFDSALDFTGIASGSHTLTITTLDLAGNAIASSLSVTVADPTAPVISAGLSRDTAPGGATNADGITSDPGISGTIASGSNITQFKAGLDTASIESFTDVLSSLGADGSFSFDRERMNQIAGGTLSEGAHTLHLVATDAFNNTSSVFDVAFSFDATAPVLDLLTPVAAGNHSDTARLIGQVTDAGATAAGAIQYALDGQPAVSLATDSSGQFDAALQSSPLTAGSHSIVVTGFDAAGNATQQTSVDFQVTPPEFVLGPTASVGWGVKTADSVILGEQNSSLSQTTMSIALGQTEGSRKLRFDLNSLFDKSDANTLAADRFSVYLVDPANPTQTLLDNGEPGTALFALSERGAEFTPGLVRYDGQAVEVDLTSLTNYSSGLLVFQLLNGDEDAGSRVQVQQISNELDPEGVESPVFPVASNPVKAGAAIDLSNLSPTNDLQVLLSNVRLDDTTGRYTANVQVQNNGAATGRQVAIVFPNLPTGVQLQSPSGTDSTGAPYISLQDSISPGGLAAGATSDPVEVVFDNPNLVQFDLAATVLSGEANRASVFDNVGQLSVMPGHRLEVPLVATDADGDTVTFTIKSDNPLPTGNLDGNGKLVFAPKPDEVGTYNFTLIATDGAVETSQDVQLTVAADPITTTRVSGVIQNTSQAPLPGIAIEVGGVQTTTAADGSFLLEFTGELPSDTLKVHGEQVGGEVVYPFIAEKLPLVLGHDVYSNVNNVISRPIYLPPLDVASGQTIDPDRDVTVTTANIPGAAVRVAAGSLKDQAGNPFAGTLSITEVPTELTPAALPENLHPDIVVTIQPGEMVFTTPAPLTLPNRAGYAPGAEMDLWSINPTTGDFDKVGTGRVSADGSVVETIEGGIRNSSWHFWSPPPPTPKDPNRDPRNRDKGCENCEAGGNFNSEVKLHSGAVTETHELVPYQSLGISRGLSLRYDSLRADPRPTVHFGYNNVQPNSQERLVAKLSVSRGNFSYQLPGFVSQSDAASFQNGYHFWSLPASGSMDAALQVDLRAQPTGQYTYKLQNGILRATSLAGIPDPIFAGSSSETTGQLLTWQLLRVHFLKRHKQ